MVSSSCSKDGEDGATGIKGVAGADGTDGINGVNGVDGNANVISIRFQSPEWHSSSLDWLGLAYLDVPQITNDDINFSLILTYVSFNNQTYIPLPVDDRFINGIGDGFSLENNMSAGSSQIRFKKTVFEPLPSPLPSIDFVKIIIIKPSETVTVVGNTSGKGLSAKQTILETLKNAGVDVEDYFAVCKHYGIEL